MNITDLLLAAESARLQRAVRRTAYRHFHLADNPLIIVVYNLSGEAAAPLGIMYGVVPDPDRASLAVAAEPRNRDSRFELINTFAEDFVRYIDPYLELHTITTTKGGARRVTSDAPQVIVPNRASRAFLGARLGRSLRYLGLGETHEVPEPTQWTGSHLSWLAEHSQLPGQSMFVAMTEALTHHYVTGQSAFEDENLATLLAWIQGVEGDPLALLEDLENSAYGPVPDPRWEAAIEPHVKEYSNGLRAEDQVMMSRAQGLVVEAVREKLSEAYSATHRAVQVLRGIPAAPTVAERWSGERFDWSDHARRCEKGIPRFARRHDALRAAKTLQRWSSAAEMFEISQAFDDPMIMARYDAEGRCVSGTITDLDENHREVKENRVNMTRVPLLEITLSGQTQVLEDETVRWTDDKRVTAKVRTVDATHAVIAIVGGIRAFDSSGPSIGDQAMFVALDLWEGRDPLSPEDVPWTHREPTTSELAGDGGGDVPQGDEDGSPDLTATELGSIQVIGVLGPEDGPGVVL